MPIIQSAAKRVRHDKTRYRRNLSYKRAMKTAIKDVTDAVSSNDEKTARAQLPIAQKAIDKAVKQGVIHKNTASRKKSQLTRQIDSTFGEKKVAKQSTAATKPKTTSSQAKSSSSTKKTTAKKPASSSSKSKKSS